MTTAKGPAWLANTVFYQIYPQSFYDTNGDGIGDIPGIIEKLDYIASLGVGALWLNPCFVSPFRDAGYDVADFYKVAPRYGTNADLARLFREAHRRGLKVVLDLVAGHTSTDHPWFKASSRHERNAHSDWYIWTDSIWNPGDGRMRFVNGFGERNGNFATNFFYCQPALNYGFAKPDPKHPWQQPTDAPGPRAVKAELKKIMQFWLEKGCDGFRVDMASSLIKHDVGKKAMTAFWREFRAWFERDYPEAVLVAEWGNPTEAIRAGYHVDFMIHFGTPGYPSLFFKAKSDCWVHGDCFFDRRGKGTVTEFLAQYFNQHHATRRKGYISIPTGNHDFQRPNSGRTKRELEVVMAFIFTWPGVPFLYYGDEIGMRFLEGLPSKEGGYGRTGTRTPMQWTPGRNAGFSTAPASKLYLPVDPAKGRPDVQTQESSRSSLLNHVRRLIALRSAHPALAADGDVECVYAKPGKYPFVHLRKKGRERFLIAVNPSAEPVTVTLDVKGVGAPVLARGVATTTHGTRTRLAMEGVSFGIFPG